VESEHSDNAQKEILSGWKDIAHYLGKGVRTVQRYERQMGLPVRRPSGNHSGSVIAIKSELDSWIRSSPTAQEYRDEILSAKRAYLSSEIVKRLQERAHLRAQMTALRRELRVNIRKLRKSIAEVRQQLHETRERQDSMASLIKQYSKVPALFAVNVNNRKPN